MSAEALSPAATVTAVFHIFEPPNKNAVKSFIVFKHIFLSEDYSNFINRLSLEHQLKDKCLAIGISSYSIDVSLYEKELKRPILIDENNGWAIAKNRLVSSPENHELHGKFLFRFYTFYCWIICL